MSAVRCTDYFVTRILNMLIMGLIGINRVYLCSLASFRATLKPVFRLFS